MAKKLDVRGRFKAHYADHSEYATVGARVLADYPTEEGSTGVWDSAYIQLSNSTTNILGWTGLDNWPSTNKISLRWRIIPRFTGTPSANQLILDAKSAFDPFRMSGALIYINTAGNVVVALYRNSNVAGLSITIIPSSAIDFVDGTPIDLMLTYNGDGGGAWRFSSDGVELGLGTAGSIVDRDNGAVGQLGFGNIGTIHSSEFDLLQLEIWDTVENHVYSVRTDYDATPIKQPLTNTFPSVSDVVTTANWLEQGIQKEGELGISTDPGIANVKLNEVYYINGVELTGELEIGVPTASQIAAAVWDADLGDHNTAGSFGTLVKKLLTVGKFLGLK